jgi:hypothetical protein
MYSLQPLDIHTQFYAIAIATRAFVETFQDLRFGEVTCREILREHLDSAGGFLAQASHGLQSFWLITFFEQHADMTIVTGNTQCHFVVDPISSICIYLSEPATIFCYQ